jgi:hypothetical protein
MIDDGTMGNNTSPNQQHEKQQQPKQVTASSSKPDTKKRMTSIDDAIAGGDEKHHFLLRKKKESLDKLMVDILMEQQQQKLSALHLQALHDWMIFAPSIALTLVTGVLGILAASDFFPASGPTQTAMAFAISVIAVVSVAVQSLNKQLNFGGRAGMHAACSSQLRKLLSTVQISSREAQYGAILKTLQTGGKQPLSVIPTNDNNDKDASVDGKGRNTHDLNSDPSGDGVQGADDDKGKKAATDTSDDAKDDDDDEKKDSTNSITKQFTQAIEGVISATPIRISSAFNLMHSRIEVVNKSSIKDSPKTKVAWEKVKPAMYYQLAETIISSRGFPIQLPDATKAVDQTLKEFKGLLQGDQDQNEAFLLNALLKGAEAIDKHNDTSTTAQTSLGLTTACNMIDV